MKELDFAKMLEQKARGNELRAFVVWLRIRRLGPKC